MELIFFTDVGLADAQTVSVGYPGSTPTVFPIAIESDQLDRLK